MRKQYASSVYSAKSERSFLSLTTPIWTTTEITATAEVKQSIWQSLKFWIPITNNSSDNTIKKNNDSDSITTTRSTASSISKLKQFVFKKTTSSLLPLVDMDDEDDISSPRLSFNDDDDASSSTTTLEKKFIGGILINRGEDSPEAIAERKQRRQQRREVILKLQKHNRSLPHHFINQHHQQQIVITPLESCSLDTDNNESANNKKVVTFTDQEDCYNPRIIFVERSPVPRFRNVAPPPPPSPPYLNILIHEEVIDNNATTIHSIIKSPTASDQDEPTIFTTTARMQQISLENMIPQPLFNDENDENEHCNKKQKPRLYFRAPFYRGQTLNFSLQNTIPEDHIILFKFLTSNSGGEKGERYFVRPSAGKMENNDSTTSNVMIFLNQVSPFVKKDKLILRWAVIQKNTKIENWVNSLQDSTRRKWLDMLEEEWPSQVTIRMTRIGIRFVE